MSTYDDPPNPAASRTTDAERLQLDRITESYRLHSEARTPVHAAAADLITPARVSRILSTQHIRPGLHTRLWGAPSTHTANPATAHLLCVTAACRSLQLRLHTPRPFTDEELAVLAHHASTAFDITHMGTTAQLGATLWFFARGIPTFRFPGYTPPWKLATPDVFPLHQSPVWRGRPARLAWHALRLVAYYAATKLFIPGLFQGYANTRTMLVVGSDPRLKGLFAENRAAKEGVEARPGESMRGQAADWEWKDGGEQEKGMEEHPQTLRDRILAAQKKYREQQAARQRPHEQSPVAAQDDDPLRELGIDDASPVAPEAVEYPPRAPRPSERRQVQQKERQQAAQGDTSMSAWERIRQQAVEGNNTREKS